MTFTRGEAESLPVAAASVQLVVVGRAIHYFDTRAFFREVDRVLVGADIAVCLCLQWQCRWTTEWWPTTACTSPP